MKIYIASSWKNQHAVEMMTAILRNNGHEVISWIENNFGEQEAFKAGKSFNDWANSAESDKSFEFDTHGAMSCDLFIYVGPSGKDAAAECGMCYGARQHAIDIGGTKVPMIALEAKGEDFGLMRKMFDHWYNRYDLVIEQVELYNKGDQ